MSGHCNSYTEHACVHIPLLLLLMETYARKESQKHTQLWECIHSHVVSFEPVFYPPSCWFYRWNKDQGCIVIDALVIPKFDGCKSQLPKVHLGLLGFLPTQLQWSPVVVYIVGAPNTKEALAITIPIGFFMFLKWYLKVHSSHSIASQHQEMNLWPNVLSS